MKFSGDVSDDKLFNEFNRMKGGSESTILARRFRLNSYCRYLGKNPTELIQEAEEEQETIAKMRNRKIQTYLLDYVDHRKSEGRAKNTIKSEVSTIKSFYYNYDIDLPKQNIYFSKETSNPAFEEYPSKQTIKSVLKHANLRDKAVILLQSSSGMGSNEIRGLNYIDFINAVKEYLDPEINHHFDIKSIDKNLRKQDNLIPQWHIRRGKTGMDFITFSSPETTLAILDYLVDRSERYMVESMDEPLFITIKKTRIAGHYYSRIFQHLNDAANLGRDKDGKHVFRSHKLRKYFTNALMRSDVDKTYIDWMIGHKIDPVSAAYFKAKPADLKRQYLRGLKELTIEKTEVKQIASQEYKELLDRVKSLEKSDKQKDEEIAYLKKKNTLIESIGIQNEFKEDTS